MRRSILKYKTVQSKTAPELDAKVQEMLDAGWELCGIPYSAGSILHQCLVSGAPKQESEGLTVDDIATLLLLRGGLGRGRRW